MFGKLFGSSKPAPEPQAGPQLCMPAFASTKGLTEGSIVASWKALFPGLPPIRCTGREKSVLSFDCEGEVAMVVAIPMPIPAGDIEFACRRSWMWPQAAERMAQQKAHAIVTATTKSPEPTAIADAMLVSRLSSAMCKAGEPVGVYWGNGGQVHKPELFIDAVSTFDADGMLPCMLWVGQVISAEQREGPYSLSTMGMRPFGHKELEIINCSMRIGDLRTTVYDLVNYLLSNGPILRHGETFGPTPSDRWKVQHTTSIFRDGEPVIRLHIP